MWQTLFFLLLIISIWIAWDDDLSKRIADKYPAIEITNFAFACLGTLGTVIYFAIHLIFR